MYQALYRTYRPEVFDEILGQEHIVRILKNQVAGDVVSHAYLLCGTRGTGKTTTARILAKAVNCLADQGQRPCGVCANCEAIKEGSFMDVIEIDAASNNGVENIRELRESVKYPPATGRKKVYIIDEVHMLSSGAFNALLKTLEEPPESVIFILATTEPQKLPATILSRCLRLDFKRVPEHIIAGAMATICEQKGIKADEAALKLIATNADGSVRDGLSILDQCIAGREGALTREDVLELLGTSGVEIFVEITSYVMAGKSGAALVLLDKVLADGKDVRQFMRDWLAHYRGLLISKFINDPHDMLNISEENSEKLLRQSERIDLSEINYSIIELSKTIADAKWSTQPRILLELCIVKLSTSFNTAASIPQRGGSYERKIGGEYESVGKVAVFGQNDQATGGRQREAAEQNTETKKPADIPVEQSETTAKAVANQKDDTQEKTSEQDIRALWHSVFERGETTKTSFNLIRIGTRLDYITDKEFMVVAANDLKKDYVEDNRDILEDLMEKLTGVHRRLKCRVEGQTEEKKPESNGHNKSMVESLLGIEVSIE